ncbi:hypothetical protein ASF87_16745 [Microbacterium sp. Leaf161]|uniref:hypothetical protein n=1 Tax=Microbacterium sp. Leaf161 TaxID=1736281 RepID=UPI0006F424C0|nr:hypothetical protein [Microbacterium sp. Leaf161]KQR43438.1 hypothetical protein ASF87_16745 [Microbacterium sp. Leaf161]
MASTPETTLISRAEITSAATPATNRKLLTLDGLALDIGDTGPRDISANLLLTYITSARLILARENGFVALHGVDVLIKAGAPSSIVLQNQARSNQGMFNPPYMATGRAVATSGSGTTSGGAGADVVVNNQLGIVMHGVTPGVTYQFSVLWKTDVLWGAALPGVVDGQPIGV